MSQFSKVIRPAIFIRSKGRCEACGRHITEESMHGDHFFGRAKVPESITNCWCLCLTCDTAKTTSKPSAAQWLQRFAWHCGKHGYAAERELALSKLNVLQVKKLVRA